MIKIEIELNEQKLLEAGDTPENAWKYIDGLFCGERRHMKLTRENKTHTYAIDFNGNSWGHAMSGMQCLAKQEWFRNCVTKMFYHANDGHVEEAKNLMCEKRCMI